MPRRIAPYRTFRLTSKPKDRITLNDGFGLYLLVTRQVASSGGSIIVSMRSARCWL